MSDSRERLAALVAASGLSGRRFAQTVLAGRDERSLRRWIAEGEIPDRVTDWLDNLDWVRVNSSGSVVTIRVRV